MLVKLKNLNKVSNGFIKKNKNKKYRKTKQTKNKPKKTPQQI